MINKLVFVFVIAVIFVIGILFNYDFSSNDVVEPQIIEPKKVEKKKKIIKDVNIVYEKKRKETTKKTEEKPDFRSYVNENVKQMHTLSKTKVGDYDIAVKTPQKPKVNKLAPPQFPTILKGEINGQKFSLTLPQEAKQQSVVFTITKENHSAVVSLDTIKDAPAGQIVDIGNLTPPEDLSNAQEAQNFEQEAQSEIESSAQESQNTQSESIAPPTPPSIGG